jgi:hypothetical protein
MKIPSILILAVLPLIFTACGSSATSGVVLNEEGIAIEGAVVIIDEQIVRADEDGKWSFDREASEADFAVFAEGYEPQTLPWEDDREVTLKSRPNHTVLTFIYDDDGPLEGAAIVHLDANSYLISSLNETGPDGMVYFPQIPVSNAIFLVVKEGYELGIISKLVDGENNSFILHLDREDDGSVISQSEQDSSAFSLIPTAFAEDIEEEEDSDEEVRIFVDDPTPAEDTVSEDRVLNIVQEVLIMQINQLLEEIKELQAKDEESKKKDFLNPPNSNNFKFSGLDLSDVRHLNDLVTSHHQDLDSSLGIDNSLGFYGPVTRNSISKFENSNPFPLGKNIEFFGPVTRSNIQSLAVVPPPPVSAPREESIESPKPQVPKNLGTVKLGKNGKLMIEHKSYLVNPFSDFWNTPPLTERFQISQTNLSSLTLSSVSIQPSEPIPLTPISADQNPLPDNFKPDPNYDPFSFMDKSTPPVTINNIFVKRTGVSIDSYIGDIKLIVSPVEQPAEEVINTFLESEGREDEMIDISQIKLTTGDGETIEDNNNSSSKLQPETETIIEPVTIESAPANSGPQSSYMLGDYSNYTQMEDPVLRALFQCMDGINNQFAGLIQGCKNKHGEWTATSNNAETLGTCITADEDYRVAVKRCEDSSPIFSSTPSTEDNFELPAPNMPPTPADTYTDSTKEFNCIMESTPGIKAMQKVCDNQHSVLEDSQAYTDCLAALPGYNEAIAGLEELCEREAQTPY